MHRAIARELKRAIIAGATLLCAASPLQAQQVRIRQLTDLPFGILGTSTADRTLTDTLCVYSSIRGGGYEITATGSGSGGAFALGSGANTLPVEVQWAFAPNQTTGTALTPGVPLAGTTTNRSDSSCSFTTTATLIVVLRAAQNEAAVAGSYAGSLTLLVAPN